MTSGGAPPSTRAARLLVAAVASTIVGLLVTATAWGARLPGIAAAVIGLAAGVASTVALGRVLPESLEAAARRRRGLAIAWLVAALLATVQTARVTHFVTAQRTSAHSVIPYNVFFARHTCLSAYTEATRLAHEGANVYDKTLYDDRKIGKFDVDHFQYPPPFLVLPEIVLQVSGDFFRARALWFGVQGLAWSGVLALVAWWIGGGIGMRAGLLAVVVWIAPQTLVTLQIGNLQIGALALSVAALVAFERGRTVAGGAALGFAAASKLFPGLLVVHLLARRRWRAALATTAFVASFAAASWAIFGAKPFGDFFGYQLPRIASGEAFMWMDVPVMVPVNHSIHGLVMKLGMLGIPGMTHGAATAASTVYVLVVLGAAVLAGVRMLPEARTAAQRVGVVVAGIAVLDLASFRSPFTPDAYAFLGTLWLLTLIAAATDRASPRRWIVPAIGVLIPVLDGFLPYDPPIAVVPAAVVVQLVGIAVNVFAVLRAPVLAATPDGVTPQVGEKP